MDPVPGVLGKPGYRNRSTCSPVDAVLACRADLRSRAEYGIGGIGRSVDRRRASGGGLCHENGARRTVAPGPRGGQSVCADT